MAQKNKKIEKSSFLWEGKNKEGRVMKGEIHAHSIALVKAELRKQGILPKKVKKKSSSLFKSKGKKITPADISIFSRQMATMMKAGVPLVQSFDITAGGHSNKNMSDLIYAIKADVEAGGSFAEAISKHPLQFDDLFVNLVAAGEQSGALETLLEKIATYKEKTEALKAKIKKALVYPVSVLIVAFIVSAILLIFVVPIFADLFSGFGADLPAFTLFVVGISDFMVAYWWIVFGIIAGSIFSIKNLFRRSKKFRNTLDRAYLKLPVVGNLVLTSSVARFSRTLSTMFAAGVPLVEALDSVAGASGNNEYVKAILTMRDDLASGLQLQSSLQAFPELFPNLVVQMVSIGEESGALDEMLGKVADFYEAEVDNAVDSLTSLMEPLIMSFLAVVIGGLVIAMYLPIFKMGQVVG
ncbi:MAG: type II secretion system protein F [endosymbiont of Galathealinum brachiosum]|uniref:Type II secretion system protein F n=1 Tax=endosymbiont of Galathealinum brachiosum TaxID=2200906 RepID=A0A370D8T3_9GAMM|nr:MAG: type II secretion system protein F [endosymbiont of Galathealinum brachiosum]